MSTAEAIAASLDEELCDAMTEFRYVEGRLDEVRESLHEVIGRMLDRGVSAYRIAQLTGLSQRHVGRIRAARGQS